MSSHKSQSLDHKLKKETVLEGESGNSEEEYLETVEDDETIDEDFGYVRKRPAHFPWDEVKMKQQGFVDKNAQKVQGATSGMEELELMIADDNISPVQRSPMANNQVGLRPHITVASTIDKIGSASSSTASLQSGDLSPASRVSPHVMKYDENDTDKGIKRKIGDKPKNVVWMQSAKIDDKGIFSDPSKVTIDLPFDEVELKRCGLIDDHCHHALTAAESGSSVLNKKQTIRVDPSNELSRSAIKLSTAELAVSPLSEVFVTLSEATTETDKTPISIMPDNVTSNDELISMETRRRNKRKLIKCFFRGTITLTKKNQR